MKTNKTLKTVALASLMGSALLLTGCGGGGGAPTVEPSYTPTAMGAIGTPTTTLTYNIPHIGNVTVNMSDLVDVEGLVDGVPLGEVTLAQVWNNAPLSAKNKIASNMGYSVSYINNNIQQVSNSVGSVDIWQAAATALNGTFTGNPFTDSEAKRAFDQIDEVGATEAWAQGWTGQGVLISSVDSRDLQGGAEALVAARFIAPGATLGDASSSDIRILDMNSVSLQRTGSPDYVKTNTKTTPWSTGRFAGVSALVMQKFPTAANASVGSAVNNSTTNGRYNALRALSPSF